MGLDKQLRPKSVVAAAHSYVHNRKSISNAIRSVVEHISPGLRTLIKPGDKVLVKVNMGCTGVRSPELRYTSHPAYVQAIIECLLDCGARVVFGDDASRAARHLQRLWTVTGMLDVANRTGAKLVDFIQAGG